MLGPAQDCASAAVLFLAGGGMFVARLGLIGVRGVVAALAIAMRRMFVLTVGQLSLVFPRCRGPRRDHLRMVLCGFARRACP